MVRVTIIWLLAILWMPKTQSMPPPVAFDAFQPLFPTFPPHCTKTSIVRSTLSHAAGDEQARTIQMNIRIGLQNTVCFRLENSTTEHNSLFADVLSARSSDQGWLHTLTLTQLEHHHPISQQYIFAIPEVRTSCICECDLTSGLCSAGSYSFAYCSTSNTSQDHSCYRTFHANQADSGCVAGSQSKLCCEVHFTPYRNRSYMALKLEQPSTFAIFKYVAYDYTAGRWIEKDKSTVRVEIDGRTQRLFLDRWLRLELGVSAAGRASHQLESGMYFADSNPGGEMEQLRKQSINELNDNNFERLGWFRKDASGQFTVRNGKVKMQKIHLAKVENCKDQKVQSYLDAHHYIDRSDPENPEKFVLEETVENVYPWISNARVVDGSARQAIVTHSEGTNLEITLQVHDDSYTLSFVHDFSRIDDFSGTIIVDFKSNRFFNLTVYNATGIIHGTVKKTTDANSADDFYFTSYIGEIRSANKTLIVPLPALIAGGDRLICIHSDDDNDERRICRIILLKEQPLEINLLENSWKELDGECAECNKLTINGFLSNLNPLNWTSGISSLSNFVMMLSDIVIYLVALFLIHYAITRCLMPVLRCAFCMPSIPFCCWSTRKRTFSSSSPSSSSSPRHKCCAVHT